MRFEKKSRKKVVYSSNYRHLKSHVFGKKIVSRKGQKKWSHANVPQTFLHNTTSLNTNICVRPLFLVLLVRPLFKPGSIELDTEPVQFNCRSYKPPAFQLKEK